jgi:hypothetical protein
VAAALISIVPGWFWARCLCATADRAERLAYSMGLSVALVPTVALLQARLTGTGVTLGISISSVLVVLVAGLLVYLKFGSAKGSAEPLVSRPVFSGPLPLIPLVLVFAVVLGILLGFVPEARYVPLLALLVFAGGVVFVFRSRRGEPPEDPGGATEPPMVPLLRWGLLLAVAALALLRSYPGPLKYDWPFPRGVDKWGHSVMVDMMLSTGFTDSFMLYPPGVHVMGAMASRFSGLEPLMLFAVLGPALLLLPALACYALARRMWGWEAGVAAAFFAALILGGTYQHVTHARYANLLGIFLLVLAVAALVRLYASASVRDALALASLGSAVVFYHQVVTLYEALLLALVGLLFLPYLLLREHRRGLALLGSLTLLFSFSVLYAWDTYDLPGLVGGLLGGSEVGKGGEAVSMALGTKPKFPFEHLLETISQPALWLGFFGGLLLLGRWRGRAETPDILARATLVVWAAFMFAGSQTVASSFPDRFERDLSLPLAVLAGMAFVVLVRSTLSRRPAVLAVALPTTLLVVAAVGLQMAQNLEEGAGPPARFIDKPPPPDVVEVGEWLKEHNDGGRILVTLSVGSVSARGVLAMGSYSGMQTYSVYRIERNRDLPPAGAGPLWDAQWALYHPGDGRTRRILRENDVRYVVLEKGHPGVDLRRYREHEDLYRQVYENEVAVVFETQNI